MCNKTKKKHIKTQTQTYERVLASYELYIHRDEHGNGGKNRSISRAQWRCAARVFYV